MVQHVESRVLNCFLFILIQTEIHLHWFVVIVNYMFDLVTDLNGVDLVEIMVVVCFKDLQIVFESVDS